jgi:urate oxidase
MFLYHMAHRILRRVPTLKHHFYEKNYVICINVAHE